MNTGTSGGLFRGGAGIKWAMSENKTADVDYNSSAPYLVAGAIEYTYRGNAEYNITSFKSTSPTTGHYVATPTGGDVTATYTIAGETKTVAVQEAAHSTDFSCTSPTSLELDVIVPHGPIIYHLERNGPPPA